MEKVMQEQLHKLLLFFYVMPEEKVNVFEI